MKKSSSTNKITWSLYFEEKGNWSIFMMENSILFNDLKFDDFLNGGGS